MKPKTKAVRKAARAAAPRRAKPAVKITVQKLDANQLHIGKNYPEHGGVFSGIAKGEGKEPDQAIFRAVGAAAEAIRGPWGPDKNIPAAQSRLDGMANTRAMAAAGSEIAKKALALKIGKHKDYHIAAARVARVVAANEEDVYDNWRWTSTQLRDYPVYAWVQDFDGGDQLIDLKSDSRAVFLVRSVPIR